MRLHGNLKKWNDDRGFGFIVSSQRKNELFVHISAFPKDGKRPTTDEKVSFEVHTDANGKSRAIRVQRTGTSNFKRSINVSKPSKRGIGFKTGLIVFISTISAYSYYNKNSSPENYQHVAPMKKLQPAIIINNHYTCDGRQYCSQMSSREEAEYFIQNCPNTKMDGDNDKIPCENDSRF